MSTCSGTTAALLLTGLLLPCLPVAALPAPEAASSWIARGGAGRGPGGFAAAGQRGGGSTRAFTGFGAASGSGALNRGNVRPTGGWSSKVGSDRALPSMDRAGGNRNLNRNVSRNVNRSWGRSVSLNKVNLYPGWARPGWAVACPWSYGWYGGWATPAWGWWGARAAAWGITSLTTAAVINAAVNNAVDNHVSTIVAPNTDYALQYGTIAPQGRDGVTFVVTSGGSSVQLSADCNQGTLNGNDPQTAAEAELINAACQVAFGSG